MSKPLNDVLLPGEVARLAGISADALAYHEKTGALKPFMRASGNRRLFARADVERWLAYRAERAKRDRRYAEARP